MKTLTIQAAAVLAACAAIAEARAHDRLQGPTQTLLHQALSSTPPPYAPSPAPCRHRCGPRRHGPGTAYSAALHGWADLVRAMGQYNLDTAVAMRHYEEARSRHMDNDLKGVAVYFGKKELNGAYRNARRNDASTSNIAWPWALTGYDFREYRARLCGVAAKEASGRFVSAKEWTRLFNMTNWAQRELGYKFRGNPCFGSADQFLRTVARHAQSRMA